MTKRLRGESTSPTKGETTPCLTRNKPITDESLECIWCEQWQHRDGVKMTAEQYSNLRDLPLNIVFFCPECVRKLPSALLAYDKTNEVCESIEKKIDSVETTLSNKFATLADQLTDLSSK